MKGQNDPIFYEKLAIKQLTHEAEIELMKDSVLASSGVSVSYTHLTLPTTPYV